jgi:hypothetical protein
VAQLLWQHMRDSQTSDAALRSPISNSNGNGTEIKVAMAVPVPASIPAVASSVVPVVAASVIPSLSLSIPQSSSRSNGVPLSALEIGAMSDAIFAAYIEPSSLETTLRQLSASNKRLLLASIYDRIIRQPSPLITKRLADEVAFQHGLLASFSHSYSYHLCINDNSCC